jgi:hypothetical protein
MSITISLFSSRFDNIPTKADGSWADLCEGLDDVRKTHYDRKEDASLLSPAIFHNPTRSKHPDNTSNIIVLDVDHGMMISEARDILDELCLAYIFYTTASHREEEHRFRVVIPADREMTDQEHRHLVRLLHEQMGFAIDKSKAGPESLFYFPGMYRNVDNRFEVQDGAELPVDAVLEAFPIPPPPPPPPPPTKVQQLKKIIRQPKRAALDWGTLDSVPPKFIDDYAYCRKADSHWNGMFTFMMQVAGYADWRGHPITQGDLADLGERLDATITHGKLVGKRCDFQRRAGDALRRI